jgi:solute:Na+ symporter, SSS family
LSTPDWIILIICLAGIIAYGLYKSKAAKNSEGYFLNNRATPWYIILLGIMGTQASAVTFLSGPGQAYTDGLRFVQYYFGLPFAMLIIAYVFVPAYAKLKITTAYEFLEHRFNAKTRTFTAALFLLSRGLSTGVSIFAPAIVLSSLFGWSIYTTTILVGGLLIVYTVAGGASAVAHTQKIQMVLVFLVLAGLFYFGWQNVQNSSNGSGWLHTAKQSGKLNFITTGFTNGKFNWADRYNIFSGLIGGFFLALSYFGTDHSQVGRYITGKNTAQSKQGLLLNGLIKIPMQYLILFLGILAFVFFTSTNAPIYFNTQQQQAALKTPYATTLQQLQNTYKQKQMQQASPSELSQIKTNYIATLKQALPGQDVSDTNYIYLTYVLQTMPKGLVGLFIAILFLSAWGSIAAALNALAACTVIDIHIKFINKNANTFKLGKIYTLAWGLFCIVVALFASNIGNSLIETVNIIGSIFYGVILGIFLVALFNKTINGNTVFVAAIIAQLLVIAIYFFNIVGFLWLNVIGALLVIILAAVIKLLSKK